MSANNKNHTAVAAHLSIREVIGLEKPGTNDWARLHGMQYCLVPHRMHIRIAMHGMGFVLTCLALMHAMHPVILAIWGVALCAAVAQSARLDAELVDADQRAFSIREMKRHALASVVKGGVWGSGLIAVAWVGNSAAVLLVWAVISLLILTTSASRFNAPLSSIAFSLVAALGGFIAAIVAGDYILAPITVGTGLLGALGAVESARVALAGRLAEAAMQEKSQVVSMLLREFEEGQADWLWQVDTHRRLRSVSPRLAFALTREISEVEGTSLLQLISGDGWKLGQFPESLHELADKLKRKASFSNLIVQVNIRGERRWWELSGTPIMNEDGEYQGFRGVGSDVTEQRESSEKIAYLARYDTLTSLPNRLMINESLGDALRYVEKWRTRCAFLMIDLDRFKAVNDSLGHLVGDKLLAQVAARLKSLTREGELCGRLGGDEFAIVIRDAPDRHRTSELATAVISQLSEPYHIENQVLYVGASVGSATGPRDGCTVEELLRSADLALYRAKDAGGGEHCPYEPSFHATAEEKRQLEHSLRSALERNELTLHFQPVVSAETERVISFEALARWHSGEHGIVSPAKFIPLAEDTRLIVPIGTWVMQEACREAAKHWPDDVKVNVNVSPEQLLEPDFAASVVRALSHSGLAPHRLEIEVTESIFLRDASVARNALEQCMALGCSVALDDFGTGYSSLGYLRKLRFSTIKIDRTFVQGAAQKSPESLAIIRAVVAMADSLGMTTTAEGVETQEEAALIRQLGCTKIQGYHFGRPMPGEDARKVFSRQAGYGQRKSA